MKTRLSLSDILKDPNTKLNVGKLDFNDPEVKAVLEQAKNR
jgi:hypothetical protein